MKILFVDDEPYTLSSTRRLMSQYPAYTTFYAGGADEAMTILDQDNIDIVITDMRMPGTSGFDLLKRVKDRHPSVIRLIMSGSSETDEATKTIMTGMASSYLLKPMNGEDFQSMIKSAETVRNAVSNEKIRELITSTGPLPVIKEHQKRILDMIHSDIDLTEIASEIEQDPILSTNILKLANSAYYGFGANVSSVKDSVICIGLSNIKSVIFTLSSIEDQKLDSATKEEMFNLMNHAALTNRLFHAFYRKIAKEPLPETCRSMGLVHDVGLFLAHLRMPEETASAAKTAKANPECSITESELYHIGAAHTEIGAYLLNLWSFPHALMEAALYHHDPVSAHLSEEDRKRMAIFSIADQCAWQKMPSGCINHTEPIESEVFDAACTTREEIEAIMIQELE